MKKHLPWIIGGVAILVGAYFMYSKAPSNTEPVAESGTMPITLSLETQNNLGQSGTAVLSENAEGKVVVALTLTGGTFKDPQPAHIHLGECPSPGTVVHQLTNVVDGKSSTTLSVSFAELQASNEKMAINVHKSAAEASVYTACGNLPDTSGY